MKDKQLVTCAIFQLADRVLRTDNSVKLQAENIAPSVMGKAMKTHSGQNKASTRFNFDTS